MLVFGDTEKLKISDHNLLLIIFVFIFGKMTVITNNITAYGERILCVTFSCMVPMRLCMESTHQIRWSKCLWPTVGWLLQGSLPPKRTPEHHLLLTIYISNKVQELKLLLFSREFTFVCLSIRKFNSKSSSSSPKGFISCSATWKKKNCRIYT